MHFQSVGTQKLIVNQIKKTQLRMYSRSLGIFGGALETGKSNAIGVPLKL